MPFPSKPELRRTRRYQAKMWIGCGLSVARMRPGRRAAPGEVSLKRHRFSRRRQVTALWGGTMIASVEGHAV